MSLSKAQKKLQQTGFLDIPTDQIDYAAEINRLRKEKNAVILAHYYQRPEIQDIADFVGDSLALAQYAAKTDADMIVFAGVHFMAETAKILNPTKKVVLPDLKAGCSLAESAPADKFKAFKDAHPDHLVVSYVNTSAEIKALTDIVCTSSNAEKIIRSIPENQPIIFAPDRNLGDWLNKQTGRNMLLWDGACMVHEAFSIDRILQLKVENPDAEIIAHPESQRHLLKVASYIGSTSGLLDYVKNSPTQTFIVATEAGILHKMHQDNPDKILIAAPTADKTCNCSECEYMKLNTLRKLYLCMQYELPDVEIEETLRIKALKSIERMLEITNSPSLKS
ncbi:MAG: quinolinate synthase NadA [Flavobacteriaceae bacterium]|nr:quinolinate synthase NadA [Flavobacteriaceae bacterium]